MTFKFLVDRTNWRYSDDPVAQKLLIRPFLLVRNLRTCKPGQQLNIFYIKESPNSTGNMGLCIILLERVVLLNLDKNVEPQALTQKKYNDCCSN